jgi:hypothetical protein
MGEKCPIKISLQMRLPRYLSGSFTCRKAVTWDRRLYFSSKGRHAEGFFARKIRWPRPGMNPRTWVPEASMLTTRPPKPLTTVSKNWIKQLHTLPVLHFNRCLTTEYSETTAHFNGNCETDNQIYVS